MIVEGVPPKWLEATSTALCDLLALRANWDSYGAPPIHAQSVVASIDLLRAIMPHDAPAPAVVPTSRGHVQLEWHRDGIDLEIEVRSLGKYLTFFESSKTGETWEREIAWDLSPLTHCISELSKP
ncbi:MAG TPA: hypothetical protein VHC19_09435 [Pirellulales bacterium]|nr:hypothetical protein [Pirellulales bacterium]